VVFIAFVQKAREAKGLFGRSEKVKWQILCITHLPSDELEGPNRRANLDISKINVDLKDRELRFSLSKEWPMEKISGVYGSPIDTKDISLDLGEIMRWKAVNEIEAMRIQWVILHLCLKFLVYTPRVNLVKLFFVLECLSSLMY
jgi:hypothetical protein